VVENLPNLQSEVLGAREKRLAWLKSLNLTPKQIRHWGLDREQSDLAFQVRMNHTMRMLEGKQE
jgi:hypothetical protein